MGHQQDKIIAIDFETYSAAPLPEVGLANYVADPTFQPTLCAVALDHGTQLINFVHDSGALNKLVGYVHREGVTVVAHNAGFERAVLRRLGIEIPIHDSAVVAAVAGANRHLRGAAEQLLDQGKLDEDGKLLRLFAMPQPEQEDLEFDTNLPTQHMDEWEQFKSYCIRDAELARQIYIEWSSDTPLHEREMAYAQLTLAMNEAGWPVDVEAAKVMRDLYLGNLDAIQRDFAEDIDDELNLVSHTQLKQWCADRGINAKSFDKENVAKMIARLEKRGSLTPGQQEVLRMLHTKRELGGTSLKKLDAIINMAHNGRVYDQYVHAGAAQTLRTSGRSIQMQNLPRLPQDPIDMDKLDVTDVACQYTNDELGANLRQLFRGENPDDLLFVADYGSIESRALAWLAGEQWKLDAYVNGIGIYESLAAKQFSKSIESVTKEERTFGKVGELACQYGAGAGAVKDFASKMSVELNEAQAKQLVNGWRDADPKTVELWHTLNELLHSVVDTDLSATAELGQPGYTVTFRRTVTPESLTRMDSKAQSVEMLVSSRWEGVILRRVFHGCYQRGGNIGYYKPSSLKGGAPWKKSYTDPKTGLNRKYELYGGKLTGILTQSLCREIFFDGLKEIAAYLRPHPNVKLIGQFHDEVIVEWTPSSHRDAATQQDVSRILNDIMSSTRIIKGLPMTVEVKADRRYIK